MSKQTLSFQAEVKQILHLVTHSLYSNKEIFLRELVSNASDACDKLRFEALDNAALYEDAPNLEVRVAFDAEAKTITITDNGIGMTPRRRSPTWAPSPRAARASSWPRSKATRRRTRSLIGQFGVGFYSRLHRRRPHHRRVAPRRPAAPTRACAGVSEGTGDFEVETITRPERGTSVTLHLRDGEDEFLSAWKLQVDHRQVLRPHLAADPDAQGGVGRRGRQRAGRSSRRVGAGQQGRRAVDAHQERHHRRSSTRSSTSRSATTARRRWPTRTTASRAAASTRSCCTSRPRRRSTCGTATSAAASSCTSSASSSWTTPRR